MRVAQVWDACHEPTFCEISLSETDTFLHPCVVQHGEWDVGDYIFWRIIYTSTFFLLINTILMNIIFGVINPKPESINPKP